MVCHSQKSVAVFLIVTISCLFFSSAYADGYCFKEAGTRYGVSHILLKAISEVESGGDIHAVNFNRSSSTLDVGHMQINSYWKKFLGDRYDALFEGCYCTMVGAWILKQCIERYDYSWDAVSCYHTGSGLSDGNSDRKRENGLKYVRKVQNTLGIMGDFKISEQKDSK